MKAFWPLLTLAISTSACQPVRPPMGMEAASSVVTFVGLNATEASLTATDLAMVLMSRSSGLA